MKDIYEFYKDFISKLFSQKDNKIPISCSIIDINKFDYISTFIVLQSDFKKYEKKLLFNELEKLSKINDKKQYDTYEKQLVSNFNFESVSEDVKNHFYIQGHKKFNNKFSEMFCFICKDLLLKINNEKIYSDFLGNKEIFLFFINNNDYFVYSSIYQKLYNVIFQENNKIVFKLKEYEFNLEFENVLQILKELYQNEKRIEYYINKNLSMKDSLKTYKIYLINREWMKNYKKFFNYDLYVNNGKKSLNTSLSIFKKKDFSDDLKNQKNLIPNYDNSFNCNTPIDFEIVEKVS